MNINKKFQIKKLRPLNIWLSGAIPEIEAWKHPLVDRDILEFVSFFSSLVFKKGGRLIHGCHPLFTPVIVEQAKRFSTSQDQLQLCVSNMWGTKEIEQYADHARIHVVPSFQNSKDFNDPIARNKSLTMLRMEIVRKSNCIVSIGGKLHAGSQIAAGVPEEVNLAKKFRLPCYNLGGFGGAASEAQVNKADNYYLSNEEYLYLTESTEVSFLPSNLARLLGRDATKIALNNKLLKFLSFLLNKNEI